MQDHQEAQEVEKREKMLKAIAYSELTITMMKNNRKHEQQWCDKEVRENDEEEETEVDAQSF